MTTMAMVSTSTPSPAGPLVMSRFSGTEVSWVVVSDYRIPLETPKAEVEDFTVACHMRGGLLTSLLIELAANGFSSHIIR